MPPILNRSRRIIAGVPSASTSAIMALDMLEPPNFCGIFADSDPLRRNHFKVSAVSFLTNENARFA
jgi:hypothetical protein